MHDEFNKRLKPGCVDGTFQLCYVHDDIIFTHAGLTKSWCENNHIDYETIKDLETHLNNYFTHNTGAFNFKMKGFSTDYTGDNTFQGPLWVRPYSLLRDKIDGYRQVVGHTKFEEIPKDPKEGIYFIDVLQFKDEYLIVEDGEIRSEILV